MDKINIGENEIFQCLVIKLGVIKDISWKDPNYINKILELDYIESITLTGKTFLDELAKKLDVNNFLVKNLSANTEIVGEEPYYLYELIYLDLENEIQYHTNTNDIGNLLSINGDKIYSNAILFKNHIPSLTDSMNLCDMTKEDLRRLLYKRGHNTIVLGDSFENKFIEDTVLGEIEPYAKRFFENDKYIKKEFAFLMHNINIWYSIGITENKICGNLVNEKYIDKCIFFTMKTDVYRDNLTLDEVNKIIYLSLKLDNYQIPSEFTEEKNDNLGRKIIYNKFKILDQLYYNNK